MKTLKLTSLHIIVFFQAAFAKAKQIYSPTGTGAVLCGQKQMTEVCYFIYLSMVMFSHNLSEHIFFLQL